MKFGQIRAAAALVGAAALLFDATASFAMTLAPVSVPTPVTLAFHAGVHGGGFHGGVRAGGFHGGARVGGVHGGVYRGGAVYHGRGGVYGGRGVYGRPGYYGAWRRPGYGWAPGGAIAAGAAIGVLSAAAAAAYISTRPPGPGLCWYYTDPSRTAGFWDACQ